MRLLINHINKIFLVGLSFWIVATLSYFFSVQKGFDVSPIAEDGLTSLLTAYIPVLFLAVFLLLYLTRKRDAVNWSNLYSVKKSTSKREVWLTVVYLLVTQLIMGLGFNMGLHFPGTDVYSTGSHSQADVWVWAITYTIIYTIIPLIWLRGRGFSLKKLFGSFKWTRDLWIIIAYWAIDFFGPLISGSTDFIGGISSSQYAKGIPLGILINTLGACLLYTSPSPRD